MTRPKLIMLCGVPGAGKTTYTRRSQFDSFVKLNTDDYLMKMAAEENITYGQSFNAHILQADYELVENFKAALKSESNIILDQLNLTVAVRRKKLLRVPPEIYDRIAVGFDIDDNVIIERNNERAKLDRGIPEPILKTYMERFTMPTIKEGFDEIWGKDDIVF